MTEFNNQPQWNPFELTERTQTQTGAGQAEALSAWVTTQREQEVRAAGPAAQQPATEDQMRTWARQLDSEAFRVRDSAHRQLEQQGMAAVPLLRELLPNAVSLEQSRRMEQIISRVSTTPNLLDGLSHSNRAVRDVSEQLLSRVGTTDLLSEATRANLSQAQRDALRDTIARRNTPEELSRMYSGATTERDLRAGLGQSMLFDPNRVAYSSYLLGAHLAANGTNEQLNEATTLLERGLNGLKPSLQAHALTELARVQLRQENPQGFLDASRRLIDHTNQIAPNSIEAARDGYAASLQQMRSALDGGRINFTATQRAALETLYANTNSDYQAFQRRHPLPEKAR